MIKPEDIKAGQSYACYFKAEMMLDIYDRPPGISDTPLKGPGWYEGFGLIQTRESEKKLFEIIDQESNKKMIVPWDQCWDIDEAELVKE